MQEIIKQLEIARAYSGERNYAVYADWLAVVEATVEALPAHLRSMQETGAPAADTPETQELWARLRGKYQRHQAQVFDAYAAAFGLLWQATQDNLAAGEYRDVLGNIYQEWGSPDTWKGQFFTPYAVARAMARVQNIPAGVHARVSEVCQRSDNPLLAAILLTCSAIPADERDAGQDLFFNWFLPTLVSDAAFTPATVHDCACGSGIMLLAAAATCPRWMIDYGLVQFSGQDIDYGCVQMARINCALYGLNGAHLRWALSVRDAGIIEIDSRPAALLPAPARVGLPVGQLVLDLVL